MKKWILLFTLCWISTLGIGQIDSSAWDGKVVLMIIKKTSKSNYEARTKAIKDTWYLTDTNHLILDSLLTRDVDSFGEDTIIIVSEETGWLKCYHRNRCLSVDIEDCLMWEMYERIRIKNLINREWATFVVFPDRSNKSVDYGYQRLLVANQESSFAKKKVILKINSWSKELEVLIKERFKDFEIRTNFEIGYDTYTKDDAIIVFKRYDSEFVEIVDARTRRVIEKIKIPVSKE